MTKVNCKDCDGYNKCGEHASNDDEGCGGYQPKDILEKYKDKLDIGVYLAIKEYIDELEKDLKVCETDCEIKLEEQHRSHKSMSFKDRLKFLFRRK